MWNTLTKIGNRGKGECWRKSSTNSPASPVTPIPTQTPSEQSDGGNRYKLFDEMISERRKEASRSILVSVQSDRAIKSLIGYCSRFGTVSNCFTYRNKLQATHCLLEFKSSFAASSALRSISYAPSNEVASKSLSHFLMFSPKDSQAHRESDAPQCKVSVQRSAIESRDLSKVVRRQDSLDDHVQQLYEQTRLSELATRLRFMAALQIESMVGSIFPSARALPFGSSVNGFGRMGSDLDVVLTIANDLTKNDSPLKFISKEQPGTERYHHMVILQTITMLMEKWTPGVANMQPVLNAKVPIIKYRQSFFDLDVDLSAHNLSGCYMSEMLYLFGEIDARVRPLIFFIRRWAEEWKVTRVIRPGPWISNFTLSCLVLFFLQQLKPPILPSIDELKRQAPHSDKRSITDDTDCIFLRDINRLDFKTANSDSLEQLIAQFFDFYANLDFERIVISLNTGHTLPSSNTAPMHIINPLEPEHNVSINVSQQEVSDFKRKAKQACESFLELQRGFVPNDQKKFIQFFEHKQANDIRGNILSRMNADIHRNSNPRSSPKKSQGGPKNTISVRSLTKLT